MTEMNATSELMCQYYRIMDCLANMAAEYIVSNLDDILEEIEAESALREMNCC